MNEMINNIGETLIVKMRIINLYTKEWAANEKRYTESRKCNKFDHEFNGMLQLLKTMNVDFEIEYNEEVTEMTAIIIMGKRFAA